jgi:hypothetical protein
VHRLPLALVAILTIGSLLLGGCARQAEPSATATPEAGGTPLAGGDADALPREGELTLDEIAQIAATAKASGASATPGIPFTWDDMPVYPGAELEANAPEITPEGEDFHSETRTYATLDAAEDVAAFYKSAMAEYGWDEAVWTRYGETVVGIYTKVDQGNVAQVMIVDEAEGLTSIHLKLAYEEGGQ